jgi:hypothetical protein
MKDESYLVQANLTKFYQLQLWSVESLEEVGLCGRI